MRFTKLQGPSRGTANCLWNFCHRRSGLCWRELNARLGHQLLVNCRIAVQITSVRSLRHTTRDTWYQWQTQACVRDYYGFSNQSFGGPSMLSAHVSMIYAQQRWCCSLPEVGVQHCGHTFSLGGIHIARHRHFRLHRGGMRLQSLSFRGRGRPISCCCCSC